VHTRHGDSDIRVPFAVLTDRLYAVKELWLFAYAEITRHSYYVFGGRTVDDANRVTKKMKKQQKPEFVVRLREKHSYFGSQTSSNKI